jgi:hypothetical protein
MRPPFLDSPYEKDNAVSVQYLAFLLMIPTLLMLLQMTGLISGVAE